MSFSSQKRDWPIILGLALILSFCGMSYELFLARFLASLSQNLVLSQSLSIGIYILALGAGAFTYEKISPKNPIRFLAFTEVVLAIVTATCFYLILGLHLAIEAKMLPSWLRTSEGIVYVGQPVTFLIGFLSGLELPALMAWLRPLSSRSFGWVLGVSYMGGLFASIFLGYIIFPKLGLVLTCQFLALITLACAIVLTYRSKLFKNWIQIALLVIAILIPIRVIQNKENLEQIYLKSYYYYIPLDWKLDIFDHMPKVERVSSPYQDLDIVAEKALPKPGETARDFYLFIDHKLQFASWNEKIYHESMVHAGIHLNKSIPKKVLIVGGGDGLLVRELLKYQEIEKIQVVELDPAMINLARHAPRFVGMNKNSLKEGNPRVDVKITDGFKWVKSNREIFEAVFVDLPHPYSIELSRLYSLEFYTFLARRLSENGFLIFDFPIRGLLKAGKIKDSESKTAASVVRAVELAGLGNIFAYGSWETFVIAKRGVTPFAFDYEALSSRISDVSVMNLAPVDLSTLRLSNQAPNSVFRPRVLKPVLSGT